MKDLCYSVRVESLIKYGRAYKVRSFDGSECFIPEQFVYERDWEVEKSEAYWIAAWILEKKPIQYSRKKSAWFDRQTKKKQQTYVVERLFNKELKAEETIIFCKYIDSRQACEKRFPKAKVLSYQKESFALNLQQYHNTIYFDKVWDLALRTPMRY